MQIKNFVIFGDSYSTFEGHIPKEYWPYYTPTRPDIPEVRRVEDTWWHMLATEMGASIVRNDSWSGSTLCNTAYEGQDCSESSSFIYRLNKLHSEGFFEDKDVDTVFVFGGTNDSWANAPVGALKFSDWEKRDLYEVLPAFCYFINRLGEVFPNAQVVALINPDLKPEIADGYEAACKHFGTRYVRYTEIEKYNGHPTPKGMIQIKEGIINKFCT